MATQQPYNVLFIISDQHRMDAAGCYGHPVVRTPNLDRLAKEGVRFTNAYTQCPLCGPARSATITGTYPHTCRTYTHKASPLPEMPTMGSAFREAGYATGAIGKVHVVGETRQRDLGFDDRRMRLYTYAFEDYINAIGEEAVNKYATYRTSLPRFQTVYNPTNTPIDLPEEQMFDHLVVDGCIDFLEAHTNEPFFLWAGLEKPHTDWTAPERFHRMYGPNDAILPPTLYDERTDDLPEQWYVSTRQVYCFEDGEIDNCIAAYYANVTYLDEKVGELLATLDRLGLRENTIVVYTTDHGEMCFDHGMMQKQNFFEGSTHIPLIVSCPSLLPSGAVCDNLAGLIDLFPTFTKLTGVSTPDTIEGRPLVDDLHGCTAEADRAVISEYYDWGIAERMIRQGDWKYMYAAGAPCQLYNLREDPHEMHNRISDPDCAGILQDLHTRLMADWEVPDMATTPHAGVWNDREKWFALRDDWMRKHGAARDTTP